MAAELEKLAQDYIDRGYPEFGKLLQAQLPVARKLGVPETFSTIETEKTEISRFSLEQREKLEKEGYVIRTLTGKSMDDLRVEGNLFGSTWHEEFPKFESKKSIKSEVAVKPNELFLPNSNNKTFIEQESMVAEFSKEISVKIPGVKAIIGEVVDYAELAFLSPREHRLFGRDNHYKYVMTKTEIRLGSIYIGNFHPSKGIFVNSWIFSYGDANLFIAPLIVPAENK